MSTKNLSNAEIMQFFSSNDDNNEATNSESNYTITYNNAKTFIKKVLWDPCVCIDDDKIKDIDFVTYSKLRPSDRMYFVKTEIILSKRTNMATIRLTLPFTFDSAYMGIARAFCDDIRTSESVVGCWANEHRGVLHFDIQSNFMDYPISVEQFSALHKRICAELDVMIDKLFEISVGKIRINADVEKLKIIRRREKETSNRNSSSFLSDLSDIFDDNDDDDDDIDIDDLNEEQDIPFASEEENSQE